MTHAIRVAVTTTATARATPSRKPVDSPLRSSRIEGSWSPISTNSSAFRRKVSSDHSAKPCWRTSGDASVGAHHPRATPAVTAAITPETCAASAGTYAA